MLNGFLSLCEELGHLLLFKQVVHVFLARRDSHSKTLCQNWCPSLVSLLSPAQNLAPEVSLASMNAGDLALKAKFNASRRSQPNGPIG